MSVGKDMDMEKFSAEWWADWNRRHEISTKAPHCVPECETPCRVAHARITQERRIIRRLLLLLRNSGWTVTRVWDDCENQTPKNVIQVMDAVFSVDTSVIHVKHTDGRKSWIQVVLGNGVDCISDWGENVDDVLSQLLWS